ncbi:MAG: hypothetical protein OXU37_06665 [Thaumarchaeota archaeon]|nr:hypothetical protein [Nitrososphaerota archaeon]
MRQEAEMQRCGTGVIALEAWKESLRELGECNPDEIGGDEYYELVDELERIVKSSHDAAGVRSEAGLAVAEMFGRIRGDAEYGILLERMLDRVYMVPGGQAGLGALLGGIKVEDKSNGAHAHLALDAIRVILRYLYLREGVLRASRREILEACYDAMRRVAVRNGLRNLAEIMGGKAAREEFCGPGSEICRMAMLRNGIYDKRDVPSNEEILRVLCKYPTLSDVLDPKRVIDSKWRLTRPIHYISLDHIVSHDRHGPTYTAISESNTRVRYWLGRIYHQHRIYNNSKLGLPGGTAQDPALVSTNIMVAIRYLALEICDFWDLYGKNFDLLKGLEIWDPAGIYKSVQERRIGKELQEIRDGFGAHPSWTFERAGERIDAMGMDRLVLNAHLVLMFQDAVYRAMPSRHRFDHMHGVRRAQIFAKAAPVTKAGETVIKEEYDSTSVVFRGQKAEDAHVTMRESLLCMTALLASFNGAREDCEKSAPWAFWRFSNEAHNVKYMVLEMANFTKQWEEMGADITKNGKALVPGFLERKEAYYKFRDGYSAHARLDGISGMQTMAEGHRDLLSCVLRDIVEAGALVARLSREFPKYEGFSMRLMSSIEINRIQRRLDRIRSETNGHHGGEPASPGQEQAIQEREGAKSALGLE